MLFQLADPDLTSTNHFRSVLKTAQQNLLSQSNKMALETLSDIDLKKWRKKARKIVQLGIQQVTCEPVAVV